MLHADWILISEVNFEYYRINITKEKKKKKTQFWTVDFFFDLSVSNDEQWRRATCGTRLKQKISRKWKSISFINLPKFRRKTTTSKKLLNTDEMFIYL